MNVAPLLAAYDGRKLTISPVGFRLIDELTGTSPLGTISCALDAMTAGGAWAPSSVVASRNAAGIVIFPDLGRTARRGLSGAIPLRFRARFAADLYIPFFTAMQDGLEFTASPFNDEEPPPGLTGIPQDVMLVPDVTYPFTPEIRVLRGQVRDAAGPVARVEVSHTVSERVVTDARGGFALPLRQVPLAGNVTIDAIDHRTGRAASITVTLPDALETSRIISIS
jgi:hypothetical protein